MIQEIAPYKFRIEYSKKEPKPDSFILPFYNGKLILCNEQEIKFIPYENGEGFLKENLTYLFSLDESEFFYYPIGKDLASDYEKKGYKFVKRQEIRNLSPKHYAFICVTACMLDGWYRANRYCGACGAELVHDEKERMLRCDKCSNRVYPRINPAVIVAVTNQNKLLLTTYKGRPYKSYALVAGFVEVGESFEDTVRREVMEEAGIKVKNIRYYGSQPWGFADNILAGYVCEVDGADTITRDEEELAFAGWIDRKEIDMEYSDSSLTNDMICAFKEGKI